MIELVTTQVAFQGTQTCKCCGQSRDASFFTRHGLKLSKTCKVCKPPKPYKRAAAPLAWIVDRLIANSNGCAFCPERTRCCMCFHHKDPTTKSDTISKLVNQKVVTKLLVELRKCILVCHNCHHKIHEDIICCGDVPTIAVEQIAAASLSSVDEFPS